MENIDALLIEKGLNKTETDRLDELIRLAQKQLQTLDASSIIKLIKRKDVTTYVDAKKKESKADEN